MALMDMHRKALYNTAIIITKNEQDALDALSEAILSCWKNIPLLKNTGNFKTWLTRIVINKCCDILKDRKRFSDTEHECAAEEYDYDTRMQVRENLMKLQQNDKLILTLFYFNDFSVREIAEILDITTAAVKTRLSRSRDRFKALYIKGNKVTAYEK